MGIREDIWNKTELFNNGFTMLVHDVCDVHIRFIFYRDFQPIGLIRLLFGLMIVCVVSLRRIYLWHNLWRFVDSVRLKVGNICVNAFFPTANNKIQLY